VPTRTDWEFVKTSLVILSALVVWFLGPIVSGLVKVWRVWSGKDSGALLRKDSRGRLSPHKVVDVQKQGVSDAPRDCYVTVR